MTSAQKRIYWQQHFKDWEKSQLSQKEYCNRHSINIGNFGYWRTQICGKVKVKASQPKLIPITLQKPSAWIKVFLPTGIRLEIPANVLPDILPFLNQSNQGGFNAPS